MLKNLKSNKGFTLIEMIVVLLIIAILAAASIPSMIRYIDEARRGANVAKTRSVYTAAQAQVTRVYGFTGQGGVDQLFNGKVPGSVDAGDKTKVELPTDATTDSAKNIIAFAELEKDDKFVVVRKADNGTVGSHEIDYVAFQKAGDAFYTILKSGADVTYLESADSTYAALDGKAILVP